MSTPLVRTVLTVAAMSSAVSALAASTERVAGPYAVVRAGVAADSDMRLRRSDVAPSEFRRNNDFKPGFTGAIGGGYDFGGFRLEGTVGYSNAKLDPGRQQVDGALGRARSLDLGIAGYVDLPLSRTIVPYIGAGIGASHVRASLLRPDPAVGTESQLGGRDWGFSYHVDAGLGVRVAPRTTVEVGARYTSTSKLEFDGRTGSIPQSFRARLSSVSTTVGVRQVF